MIFALCAALPNSHDTIFLVVLYNTTGLDHVPYHPEPGAKTTQRRDKRDGGLLKVLLATGCILIFPLCFLIGYLDSFCLCEYF